MEREILQDLMNDNKPKRGDKAKQGILISFRVIVLVLSSYLTFVVTDWKKDAERRDLEKKAQEDTTANFRRQVLTSLSLIASLNIQRDQDVQEIKDKIDRLQNTKADRDDLRRLETRIDNRIGMFVIPFKSFTDSTVNNLSTFVYYPPNFK